MRKELKDIINNYCLLDYDQYDETASLRDDQLNHVLVYNFKSRFSKFDRELYYGGQDDFIELEDEDIDDIEAMLIKEFEEDYEREAPDNLESGIYGYGY